jgi:hypothetical protein
MPALQEGTASRFQITRLEERIAPSAWCHPSCKPDDCHPACKPPPPPCCNPCCGDSLSLKLDIDLSLCLGL